MRENSRSQAFSSPKPILSLLFFIVAIMLILILSFIKILIKCGMNISLHQLLMLYGGRGPMVVAWLEKYACNQAWLNNVF